MTVRRYELPTHVAWKETDAAAVTELTATLSKNHRQMTEPLVAYRGGGIMAPDTEDLAPGYKLFLTADRSMAVIPVKTEAGGKLTDVVHFPTKKDTLLRFDANLAAYRQSVGDYVAAHWNKENGFSPLPKVTMIDTLPDGRFVTLDQYRPYLHSIGKGSGSLGIHALDTERLTDSDARQLVHVLDAIHPNLNDFRAYLAQNHQTVPPESLLHPDNPLTALRGQEWWVNPTAATDRLRELTGKTAAMEKEFAAIDPSFKVSSALEQTIRNNLAIFPHQNGQVDNPEAQKHLTVVHGALYPGNIHRSETPDRVSFFTVTGGDRSHIGLPGEAIDWLVTAAAASPAHQEALISEFLKLHPSEQEKRGLAMHVLYRAISESSWFAAHGTGNELGNLTKLSYDILNGNGIWQGVNTPIEAVT